ncbi:MAG: family 1 glycosylhydrolase, partial [Anaerolineae bacterium]|nr:family 1 glycosylhydrolase [Anaerolineae bacterium]
GRWKEVLDRAAECGQNAHRFSIEWSRIQPAPDRWDEEALDHYRAILRGLHERKLTPMLTLHHFSDPLWLTEKGAWENAETPALFAAFVRKVAEAVKEYVNLWTVINEPNVYTYSGYMTGEFPPGKHDSNAAYNVLLNLLRGHAAAYRVIHEIQPEAQVGTCTHFRSFVPAREWNPLDALVAGRVGQAFNGSFAQAVATGKFSFIGKNIEVPEVKGTQDFIGVNYYTRDLVEFAFDSNNFFHKRYFPPGARLSSTGFLASVPEGMFAALKWANQFKLPIMVTENGVEDPDDSLRPEYTAEHIHQVWRAINFNWPIKGYFHWSLVDNFEWERGWTQRFGLWGLNTETQARIRRKSVDLYAEICKTNSLTNEMVEKYAPAALERIFPQ